MKTLIVVDVQNDFLPQGSLAVQDGDQIVPNVNKLMDKFDLVVATQDWHPKEHGSFASNHKNRKPGEQIELFGLNQVLWPDHCVQGTNGAEFSSELNTSGIDHVIQKGTDILVDSYSGFFDNGKKKETQLNEFLKSKQVEMVFIVGLATDYCVKYTALDAAELGYRVFVVPDATKAVNINEGDYDRAIEEMKLAGIGMINSKELL